MATTKTPQVDDSGSATGADIEAQLNQLRDDVAALAEKVASFGMNKAEQLRGNLETAAAGAVQGSKRALATAENDVVREIRDRPLRAVGIAAAAGFVLAMLTRR